MPRPGSLWARGRLMAALMATALLIRVAGLRRSAGLVFGLADRLPARTESPAAPLALAEAHARVIARIAETTPGKPRCLPRSLLLATLLRRRRIAAQLWLGAGTGAAFDAHAWIEIDGVPVAEAADLEARYRRLWHLPTLSA